MVSVSDSWTDVTPEPSGDEMDCAGRVDVHEEEAKETMGEPHRGLGPAHDISGTTFLDSRRLGCVARLRDGQGHYRRRRAVKVELAVANTKDVASLDVEEAQWPDWLDDQRKLSSAKHCRQDPTSCLILRALDPQSHVGDQTTNWLNMWTCVQPSTSAEASPRSRVPTCCTPRCNAPPCSPRFQGFERVSVSSPSVSLLILTCDLL